MVTEEVRTTSIFLSLGSENEMKGTVVQAANQAVRGYTFVL